MNGYKQRMTAPSPEGDGAVRCMQLALRSAGMHPTDIDYINAHGTSTPYNDATETHAIKRVFGEHAGRLADFLELGELMCLDALTREESCGGHFREEHQTQEGEALRNDEEFTYVGAWEFAGESPKPVLHKEPLEFEYVAPTQRSYK